MQCFLGVDRFTPIVPIRRDVGLVPGSIHCNPTVQLSNQHDREQDKPLLSIMALLTHLHATMYGRKRCFSSVQRSRLTVLLHNSWSIASTSMLHFHDPVMREVSAIRVLVSTLVWLFFVLLYLLYCSETEKYLNMLFIRAVRVSWTDQRALHLCRSQN